MGQVMVKRSRLRTVAFFEIVDPKGGRMTDVDWPDLMARLSKAEPTARRFTSDTRDLIGTVYTHTDADTLLLSTVRDPGELPQRMSFTDGTIEEFEIAAGEGVIETSNVVFFNPGNVVGLIRGSTSAPTTTALEEWINGLRMTESDIEVRPLVRHELLEKLRHAAFGKAVKVRVSTSAADSLRSTSPRIADMTRSARERFGDVMVEMTIQVPRGLGHDEEGAAILQEGLGLAEALPYLKKAQMSYLDNRSHSQEVDFLRDRLAMKMLVGVRDTEGNPVRNAAAVDAIMQAYETMSEDVRLAVDRIRP